MVAETYVFCPYWTLLVYILDKSICKFWNIHMQSNYYCFLFVLLFFSEALSFDENSAGHNSMLHYGTSDSGSVLTAKAPVWRLWGISRKGITRLLFPFNLNIVCLNQSKSNAMQRCPHCI